MKLLASAAIAAALLLSACNQAAAADPIEGTWKADLASVEIDQKPSQYLLQDGVYRCSTCSPPLEVQADGAFHAVADRPYYDSMSVETVDDRTVKMVRRKGDQFASDTVMTVSPDGNSMTFEFTDATTPNAPPVKGKGVETRVGAAPAGAHAISGEWKTASFDSLNEEALTLSYDIEGDTLNMSSPSGQSYVATFGGPEVAVEGDTAGTTVTVERVSPNGIRETFRRNGKVVNVYTTTIEADGTMHTVNENPIQGSTMRYTARKTG